MSLPKSAARYDTALHTCLGFLSNAHASLLTCCLCVTQGFLQRVQNQLTNWFVKLYLLPNFVRAKQREFVRESGQSFKTLETGQTVAAAFIVVADWALQVPMPLPPQIHVRHAA